MPWKSQIENPSKNDSKRPETIHSNWNTKYNAVSTPITSNGDKNFFQQKKPSAPAGLPPPNLKPESTRTISPEMDKFEQPWWMKSSSQRDSQIIVYYTDANENPPVSSTYTHGQIITRFSNIPRYEIERIQSAIQKLFNSSLPTSIKNKLRKLTFMKRSIGFEAVFAETEKLIGKDFEMTTQLTKESPPRTRWTCKITEKCGNVRESFYIHENCELARQMSLIQMVIDFFGTETPKRKIENQADEEEIKRQKLEEISKDSKGTTDILAKKMADSIKMIDDLDANNVGPQKFIPEKKKDFASDKNIFFAKSSLTRPKEFVPNKRVNDKVSPLKKFVEEKEKSRKKSKEIENPSKAKQKDNTPVVEKNVEKVKATSQSLSEATKLSPEKSEPQPKSNMFSAFGDYSDSDEEKDEVPVDILMPSNEPIQKIPDFYLAQAVEKDPGKIYKKLTAPSAPKKSPTVEKVTPEKTVTYANFGDSRDKVYAQKSSTRQEQNMAETREAEKKMEQLLKRRSGRNKKFLNKVMNNKEDIKTSRWDEDITPTDTVDETTGKLEKNNEETSPTKTDNDSENCKLHMNIEKSDSFTPIREADTDTDVERPESFTPIKEIDTAEEEFLELLDEQSRIKNEADVSKDSQKSETSNFKFSPPPTKEKVEAIIKTVNEETALVERKLAFKKFHEAFIRLDAALNKISDRIDVIDIANLKDLQVKLWKNREETDEKSCFFLWLYETLRKLADKGCQKLCFL